MTVDASLVMLDCLIRHGDVRGDRPDFSALAALRYRGAGDPAVRQPSVRAASGGDALGGNRRYAVDAHARRACRARR